MKVIIAKCLSEMFQTSRVSCYLPCLQQKTAVRWCMSCMCEMKWGRSFYLWLWLMQLDHWHLNMLWEF